MIHIPAKIKREAKWCFSNPTIYANKWKLTGMRSYIVILTYELSF